jgi:hypothetical protein
LEHVTSTWEDSEEIRKKGRSKGRKERERGGNTDTDTDKKQET